MLAPYSRGETLSQQATTEKHTLEALNPKPQTLNPNSETLNPEPQTLPAQTAEEQRAASRREAGILLLLHPISICVKIYGSMYVCVRIYVYIYKEREREHEMDM